MAFTLLLAGETQDARSETARYDADTALRISQAAVGNSLSDLKFTGSQGQPVLLRDLQGKPLLISMVFSSCHHVCPANTKHLSSAVGAAREALGEDAFRVVTVGFDTPVDTPEAMRNFARQQGVDDPHWLFLSGSAETMRSLVEDIGFVYFPSPRGFDHLNQVTLVDGDGVIYRQIYGTAFDLPWLMEPLKQLVYGRPQANEAIGTGLLNRIRLFCTVYDPNTGRYRFDYSLFVGMGVGAMILLAVIAWLVVEYRRSRGRKKDSRVA